MTAVQDQAEHALDLVNELANDADDSRFATQAAKALAAVRALADTIDSTFATEYVVAQRGGLIFMVDMTGSTLDEALLEAHRRNVTVGPDYIVRERLTSAWQDVDA